MYMIKIKMDRGGTYLDKVSITLLKQSREMKSHISQPTVGFFRTKDRENNAIILIKSYGF